MIWPSLESIQRHMGCIICFLDVLKEVVLFLPCPVRGLLDNFTFVNPCWPLKTGPPPPLGFLHISRQVSVLLRYHNNTRVTQSGPTFISDFMKTADREIHSSDFSCSFLQAGRLLRFQYSATPDSFTILASK